MMFACYRGCTCGATGCPGSSYSYSSNSTSYSNNYSREIVIIDSRKEWEKIRDELKSLRWKRRQESDPGCPSRNKKPEITFIQREKIWIARVLNCARQ